MRPTRPLPTVSGPAEILGRDGWIVVVIEEVHDEGRLLVAAGRRYTLRPLTGEWTQEGRATWEGTARLRLLDPSAVMVDE